MRRFAGTLWGVLALTGWCQSAPVPGSPEAAPTVTGQTLPVSRMLEVSKTFAKTLGGTEATKVVDQWLKDQLGEKGFTGVDLIRPIGAYGHLTPQLPSSWGVLILPITDEKEFLDFLTRTGFQFTEKKDERGHYEMTQLGRPFGEAMPSAPIRFRFHDRCAYIGYNAPPSGLEGKYLPPLGKVVEAADPSLFAVRLHLDRVDPELKKLTLSQIDQLEKQATEVTGNQPAWVGKALGSLVTVAKRNAVAIAADGEQFTVRTQFDPVLGDMVYELDLRARAGTPLAQTIAQRPPTMSRFAGMTPETAIIGVIQQFPAFAPEVRDMMAETAEELLKLANAESGETYKTLIEAVRTRAVRTLKAGEGELAGALTGPNPTGLYTAVAALAIDDPAGIEKALREQVKTLPMPLQKGFQFDQAQIGTLAVHSVPVGSFLPAAAQTMFGESSTVQIVFGPKAVYAAIGPDAKAELTRALTLTPGPSRFMDQPLNAKKLSDLLSKVGGPETEPIRQMIGSIDKLVSYQYGEISGGSTLKVRFGSTSFRYSLSSAFLLGAGG